MGERRAKRKDRKPRFIWQALLILAPVLVLAKLGAYALWRDQHLALREAEERAQQLAEEAAGRIWDELETVHLPAIQFDSLGKLLDPKPYEPVPNPHPLAVSGLSDAQRQLWSDAIGSEDPTIRTRRYEQFIRADPPSDFGAIAHFRRGLDLNRIGQTQEAIAEFIAILTRYPDALSESGLPLAVLAAMQHSADGRAQMTTPISLVNIALEHPSALTPSIIHNFSNAAQQASAESRWAEQEELRGLAKLAHPFFRTNFNYPQGMGWMAHWGPSHMDAPAMFWVTNHETVGASQFATFDEHGHLLSKSVLSRYSLHWATNHTARIWDVDTGAEVVRSAAIDPSFEVAPSADTRTEAPAATQSDKTNTAFAQRLSGIVTRANSQPVPKATSKWQRLFWNKNGLPSADSADKQSILIRAATNAMPRHLVHMTEPGEHWLLMRTVTTNGFALIAQAESDVFAALGNALSRIGTPEWLDFTVTIAGRAEVTTNSLLEMSYVQGGKGGGRYWKRAIPRYGMDVLASATRAEAGFPGVTVNAVLVSRELLLSQQKEHALWFGFVIAAAAVASIVGCFSAYRAFDKQHRLAEMKSNFVSSVSHELRAPIASIRLMAEGLERGKISEPAKQHEYFRFMVQECRRLSSMIQNVLDFARIEQGRKQYEFEPVDLAKLVEQTTKLMEPYAAERGVRLVSRIESKNGLGDLLSSSRGEGQGEEAQFIANIDGQAMQQALVNLIDNALKHSPSGEEVLVSLASPASRQPMNDDLADEARWETPSPLNGERARVRGETVPAICLSVEDHGPGIPTAEHQKIFERFYRLGSELRRETPGVGIGLSIVKHIVEAHDGRVLVESEPGKGSRFTIELPLRNGKEAQ